MADAPTRPPKKTITPGAWQEARALIYAHRGRLAVGLALMLVNRLAGLVLPSSSKWVIDRVINQHHPELLLVDRSEEHTSELQSQSNLVCRLLLEKKKKKKRNKVTRT